MLRGVGQGVQAARLEAGGTGGGPAGSRGYRRRPGWKPGVQETARLEAGGTGGGWCTTGF